ncbi:beta-lactamase/transpeptidase-like protein [Dactylonectria macrodidyma]|uniref:Beta-lactamase/transpeptidase-like protein n=1 Tax=Dactylonectria macrodidyma TaxID=307937 RepID=A0A9P9DWY2_9HYPO|nr:beta-lactamase/transpeptidase-like protein [Dactylonectria macrodidyma]
MKQRNSITLICLIFCFSYFHPCIVLSPTPEGLEEVTSSFRRSGIVVGIKSAHEEDYLLEFAYTPPKLDSRGVDEVDSDSVFRIASLSKVFPVLALLKLHKVDINDPITKYLPELRKLNKQAQEQNAIWTTDWDSVTIRALASHLSGIPADLKTDIEPFADWTELGFPPVDPTRSLNCSGFLGTPACIKKDFFKQFGKRPPVYAPFSTNTVYSNVSWALLGWVIEKAPTGMNHTFASQPDSSLGFIPDGDLCASNYYSSLNDITAFGDAVLRNELLSAAQTRKWLKPVSGTSSSGLLIGEPWEILRSNNVTKDGRLVEFYTKAGAMITYHSLMGLIPDYDLTITLLAAGPETSGGLLRIAFSEIVQELLPALEQAGKDESEKAYASTYSDEEINSTITFSIDDEPGLSVINWTVRGVDIIDTFLSIRLPPTFLTPPGLVRFRLYLTSLKTDTQSSWRSVPAVGTLEGYEDQASLFAWPDGNCNTWASLDRITY